MSKQGTFGRSSKLNTLETVHVCTFDYFKSIKNHKLTIFSKISVKQIIFSPHKLSYKLYSHELRKKNWVIIKGRCYICRFFSGNCSITWTSIIKHKIPFGFLRDRPIEFEFDMIWIAFLKSELNSCLVKDLCLNRLKHPSTR